MLFIAYMSLSIHARWIQGFYVIQHDESTQNNTEKMKASKCAGDEIHVDHDGTLDQNRKIGILYYFGFMIELIGGYFSCPEFLIIACLIIFNRNNEFSSADQTGCLVSNLNISTQTSLIVPIFGYIYLHIVS